jgi:hypothetical protein
MCSSACDSPTVGVLARLLPRPRHFEKVDGLKLFAKNKKLVSNQTRRQFGDDEMDG